MQLEYSWTERILYFALRRSKGLLATACLRPLKPYVIGLWKTVFSTGVELCYKGWRAVINTHLGGISGVDWTIKSRTLYPTRPAKHIKGSFLIGLDKSHDQNRDLWLVDRFSIPVSVPILYVIQLNLSCARFLNMLLRPGTHIWLNMCQR